MADFSEFTGPSADWLALEPNLPAIPNVGIEELKQIVNKNREELSAKGIADRGLNDKVSTNDFSITVRDGFVLDARSYHPAHIPISHPLPVYIHLHGGGYLFGTLDSEDAICSRIVADLLEKNFPIVVFNVNYRHTPEYKYPTAWNDVEDAFVWLHEHIAEVGGRGGEVVVGGISAGAQMTAALALSQLRNENPDVSACPKIAGQVLMIPCLVQLDNYAPRQEKLRSPELSSLVQCAEAPILPISRIKLFMSLLGVDQIKYNGRDHRLNPGNASAEEVKDLPPTTFGLAGNDPLRDEGFFYAQLLNENKVPTNVNVFRGVPHGFRRYGDRLSASKRWDEVMSDGISWALSHPAHDSFEIKSD
ncbi:hypothetical protein N7532_005029 [Penicillium argentinense]|uniref:Alpha/beta hydrolase fold-3 domain-containing protein n=1 Tax=Penicillium argentinense TaxID=1131581 RepID=A0A9W9FD37_9EURO|nr:uncharacterized protein N7532_005029 [Penicillium argentinense]KAJ5098028.1 hypothetical protein N7532_005029 [Penicillium argentinense]